MIIPVPQELPIIKEVRIENTNACGFKCIFCPREKMDRKQGVQSINDFSLVLDRVEEYIGGKFCKTVYLHGYGEPLLDKNLIQKAKLCKERWPNSRPLIITTLGYKLEPSYIEQLICCGLFEIQVSFYGSDKKTYMDHAAVDRFDLAFQNLKLLSEYKKKYSSPTIIKVKKRIINLRETMDQPNRGSFLNELKKLDNIKISNIGLHNFGNGRDYAKSKKLLCDRAIKRNLLQVTWDLNIVPCCFDYNSEEKWGNLRDMSLKDIFLSERSTKFVKDHCEENADVYSICKNCTMRCSTKIS